MPRGTEFRENPGQSSGNSHHVLRTTALQGAWRRTQPNRIRTWLFRLPSKLTLDARKLHVQLLRREPVRPLLLQASRRRTASGFLRSVRDRLSLPGIPPLWSETARVRARYAHRLQNAPTPPIPEGPEALASSRALLLQHSEEHHRRPIVALRRPVQDPGLHPQAIRVVQAPGVQNSVWLASNVCCLAVPEDCNESHPRCPVVGWNARASTHHLVTVTGG